MKTTTFEILAIAALTLMLSFGFLVGIAALAAFILMLAWNGFMPPIFNLPEISFFQAFALTFLLSSVKGLLSVTFNKKEVE